MIKAAIAFVLLAGSAHAATPAENSAPRPSTAQPNVHVLAPLAMPGLDRERTLRIYLPPNYAHSKRRYPV